MKDRGDSHGDVIFVDRPERPYIVPEVWGIQGIHHSIAYKGPDGHMQLKF